MRWNQLAVVAMTFGLALPTPGCGEPGPTAKKVIDKASETWDAMKTWGIEKKDDFVKSASPKIDELKQGFADAKAAAAKKGAEAGKQLEEGWNGVEQKFDAMKTATADTWAKHRDAFLEAVDAYKQKLADSK